MAITNGYITLDLLKSALQINDTQDDAFLELAINSASRQIDQMTERQFFATTETRIFAPRDSYVCEIDDLTSLTTLKTSSNADGVFDVTWNAKDFQLEPLNNLSGGVPMPFTHIRQSMNTCSQPIRMRQPQRSLEHLDSHRCQTRCNRLA